MRRSTTLLALAAAVLALTTACSQDAGEQESPTGTPAPTDVPTSITAQAEPTQGQPATETSSPATVTGSPDAAQTEELLTRLNTIAPGLGDDRARAVTAAAELCQEILNEDDEAAASSQAAARFAADGVAPLTDEQSRAVVDTVRSSFCHE